MQDHGELLISLRFIIKFTYKLLILDLNSSHSECEQNVKLCVNCNC